MLCDHGWGHTIVSVTYGVGTHPRGGSELESSCREKRRRPNLEALRRAAALSGGCRAVLVVPSIVEAIGITRMCGLGKARFV